MTGNAFGHLVINSLRDFRALIVVNGYNVLVISASLLIPRLHRFGEHTGAFALLITILLGHTFGGGCDRAPCPHDG
jgi:hypothetical protein